MKLIIDIPKDNYNQIREGFYEDNCGVMAISIIDGTPLPEDRLISADALRKEVSSWGMNIYEPSDFTDEIDRAPTIIEADKED